MLLPVHYVPCFAEGLSKQLYPDFNLLRLANHFNYRKANQFVYRKKMCQNIIAFLHLSPVHLQTSCLQTQHEILQQKWTAHFPLENSQGHMPTVIYQQHNGCRHCHLVCLYR